MDCRNPTMLYVEDDPNDVALFKILLSKSTGAFDLQHVPDGEDAIAYLSGQPPYDDREKYPLPPLILSDIKMPRVNGFELLRWIRSHPRWKNLPVILFSSSNYPQDMRFASELGATDYVVKSISLWKDETLLQVLLEHLPAPKPDKSKFLRF